MLVVMLIVMLNTSARAVCVSEREIGWVRGMTPRVVQMVRWVAAGLLSPGGGGVAEGGVALQQGLVVGLQLPAALQAVGRDGHHVGPAVDRGEGREQLRRQAPERPHVLVHGAEFAAPAAQPKR